MRWSLLRTMGPLIGPDIDPEYSCEARCRRGVKCQRKGTHSIRHAHRMNVATGELFHRWWGSWY